MGLDSLTIVSITETMKRKVASMAVSTVSKGIQTTEFILTCVVNVASLVGSLSGVIPPTIALYVIAGINAVYGILRTIIKINDPSYVPPVLPTAVVTPAATPTVAA